MYIYFIFFCAYLKLIIIFLGYHRQWPNYIEGNSTKASSNCNITSRYAYNIHNPIHYSNFNVGTFFCFPSDTPHAGKFGSKLNKPKRQYFAVVTPKSRYIYIFL